ncbi:Thiamine pyrophosphate-binding protein [Gammaproteobacteria bacterium]
MRVADYIAQLLVEHGITHVFTVTGGGAMHLNDAFARNEKLQIIYCHHEQACAMAAESYARLSGRLAAINVTTGPGGINALNGVYGAYVDSIGMIVISGQVKLQTMVSSYNLPLRQLGDQEVDIVQMAKSVCKFSTILRDPVETRYIVEKAFWFAKNGRPGPSWIDVPIDIQATQIELESLRSFNSLEEQASVSTESNLVTGVALEGQVREVLRLIGEAERPVLLAGAGIRISKSHEVFLRIIDKLGIPVLTGWNAHDAVYSNHPLYVGRPGTVGDRAGNFAVQNSDLLLILGSRLNIRQVSYYWKSFARRAFKVMVDIDRAELMKPTLSIDMPIHTDLKDFLKTIEKLPYQPNPQHTSYVYWCKERVKKYPTVLPEYWEKSTPINPYCFIHTLYSELVEGDIVVTGNGAAAVISMQAADLKIGQRLYSNSGSASMGYDVPASIGAYYASGQRIICIAGDGSIMMNLQELQTIVGNRLPIKLFIFNNDGYSSIIQTQKNFFQDNITGCGPSSGVTFPDFSKILGAFGFGFRRCENHDTMRAIIRDTLRSEGPQAMEVILDPEQFFSPKLSSRRLEDGSMISSPLEDLSPFLSREELAENMWIPLDQ